MDRTSARVDKNVRAMDDGGPDMLSLQQVADRSGLSLATIKREITEGKLASVKVRNRRLVLLEHYREWRAQAATVTGATAGRKQQEAAWHAPGQAVERRVRGRGDGSRPKVSGGIVRPWDKP